MDQFELYFCLLLLSSCPSVLCLSIICYSLYPIFGSILPKSCARYDKGIPRRDSKYDVIIKTSNIDIVELEVLLDSFRDRGWSIVRDVSNRNRFDIPWSALKPEFQEFYAPSPYRQSPIVGSDDLNFLGPPLTVNRLESHLGLCSSCGHAQYHDYSPTISIRCDKSQELSSTFSSVGGAGEVDLGSHLPFLTGPLLPEDPPLGSPDSSGPVDSPAGFVSFYAPTAEAAGLASALAQRASVDSHPEGSPSHREH